MPELRQEKEHLVHAYVNLHNENEQIGKTLDYALKKNEKMKEENMLAKIEGEEKGFIKGMKSALKNTVMHKLQSDIVLEVVEGIYYAPDSMEDLRQMVKKYPDLHTFEYETGNTTGIIPGMRQDPAQALGAFLQNMEISQREAPKYGFIKGNAYALQGRSKSKAYRTDAYITNPTPISQIIRGYGLDPNKVLPPEKYKFK